MIIAVDFDGVVVKLGDGQGHPAMMPGAIAGLLALKAAGHVLVLYSARANRSYMYDPALDPLVRSGSMNHERRRRGADDRIALYQQMLVFIEQELPGVFDVIDDGVQGKPDADMFIDDKAMPFGPMFGMDWKSIASLYGDSP